MKRHYLFLAIFGLTIAGRAPAAGPWWIAETAMKPRGELRLDGKPWWPRARALKVGEQFTVQSTVPGGGLMLVRREQRRMIPSGDMIVWIIDDDGDLAESNPLPDTDSDCYVADYGGDGTVDQMLDYMDEDGDGDADIMEFRYFTDGRLRVGLNAVDYDDDNLMKPVIDYQRLAGDDNYFLIDTSGNSQYYHQIYNPDTGQWIPASECPFTFIDTDGDDASEVVLRFSAVPRDFDRTAEPDWANRWAIHLGPFLPMMNEMGVSAIRYSFDVDNLSGQAQPHHYEMGFNLSGYVPYKFEGMERPGRLRRPPQTNFALPIECVREVADRYPADSTGFSFREFSDGTIDLGYSKRDPEYDQRWEGIFWMWRRVIMQNTGGPVQTWNMRREFSSRPAGRRQVYYSPVDRRLHLKGAEKGWLRVGALHDREPLGEWRTYDTDGDGYFDRWECYDADGAEPYRVAEIAAADNLDFGDDYDAMFAFYNEKVIPEAARLNRLVIDNLSRLTGLNAEIPDGLRAADEPKISPGERRYLLDVTREVLYRQFRREAQRRANAYLDSREPRDAPSSPAERRISQDAYQVTVLLSRCDRLYGQGRFEELLPLIDQAWELALSLSTVR
ncbi:MAG: hypothetical protein A2W03_03910 [Candidatus Aminicenantes bacterium RBG_16_63_16]|nr:MAG: hypothetical protein A2W03_03910 [Candidatus Aminicenantes bacterium RBG_16_63_16]